MHAVSSWNTPGTTQMLRTAVVMNAVDASALVSPISAADKRHSEPAQFFLRAFDYHYSVVSVRLPVAF